MSSMNATWALLVLIGLTGSGVIGLQLGRLRGARRKLSDAEPGTVAAKEAKARVERAEDQATFGVLMVAGGFGMVALGTWGIPWLSNIQ